MIFTNNSVMSWYHLYTKTHFIELYTERNTTLFNKDRKTQSLRITHFTFIITHRISNPIWSTILLQSTRIRGSIRFSIVILGTGFRYIRMDLVQGGFVSLIVVVNLNPYQTTTGDIFCDDVWRPLFYLVRLCIRGKDDFCVLTIHLTLTKFFSK